MQNHGENKRLCTHFVKSEGNTSFCAHKFHIQIPIHAMFQSSRFSQIFDLVRTTLYKAFSSLLMKWSREITLQLYALDIGVPS